MAIVVSVCCDKLYHTVETGNYTLDAAAVIDPKAKYRSKIVIFAPYTIQYNINKFVTRPTCQFASESGALRWGTHLNIVMPFGMEKNENVVATGRLKKFDDMFSRFHRILACDRRTDGHLAMA